MGEGKDRFKTSREGILLKNYTALMDWFVWTGCWYISLTGAYLVWFIYFQLAFSV